jgi:hypothetical protein
VSEIHLVDGRDEGEECGRECEVSVAQGVPVAWNSLEREGTCTSIGCKTLRVLTMLLRELHRLRDKSQTEGPNAPLQLPSPIRMPLHAPDIKELRFGRR